MKPTNTAARTGQAAHTPTPWSVSDLTEGKGKLLRESLRIYGDGAHVATVTPNTDSAQTPFDAEEARANAAFIVRACNSHAAVVEALGLAQAMAENLRSDMVSGRQIHREACAENLAHFIEKFRAALQLAKK